MYYKYFKWLRVIIGIIFIFFTTLIFLDFRDLFSESNVNLITSLQFVPSLLKFIAFSGIASFGFLIIILLTVLLGRVYCSTICPLGIFQDIISRIGKKFKKRKKYKYLKPRNILRNMILGLVIVSAIFFSMILLNLLDPYSLYGKFSSALFRPVGVFFNNIFANILESRDIYFLYKKDQFPVHLGALLFVVPAFIAVMLMSWKYGRLYCNTICPVGTLLGWISKLSIFRIDINTMNCIKCGKCAFECKSGCINVKDLSIDHSRCVTCFNCLTVCEDDAIDFNLHAFKTANKNPAESIIHDKGRKKFIFATVTGLLSFTGIKNLKALSVSNKDEDPINKNPTTVPIEKNHTVSPPGSLSFNHFNELCTGCQLCVSQCPTGVLQPSVNQYGLSGYMQPFMDYSANYCNYECTSCSKVCPTGAILEIDEARKKTTQIGKVHFIKDNCVVYTENTACGSCSEHCPTQAVRMVPYKGSLTIPETDNSICVGCGACEHACPTVPYKAIYVDGNPIHLVAKEPESEKMDEEELEEFPF